MVIDEDVIEFGAAPDPEPEPVPTGTVIPFPRMRPNTKLAEVWAVELAKANAAGNTKHKFRSPLDVVPSVIDRRAMPPMPWPSQWPELGRRARTYTGDLIGVVGAIGGGKTSFALQCALSACAAGLPSLWVPLELDDEEVVQRLCGNMHAVHSYTVRDFWPRERIEHTMTAVSDMWRFVDRYDDVDAQFEAIEDAIRLAWKIFRVPPFVVIDHLGELVEGRDERLEILKLSKRLRKLAQRTQSYIMVLLQVSVGNQAVLTGRVDTPAASDMIGIETGGKAIASAAANCVLLSVFKQDDMVVLNAHANLSKCRHTGLEGKVGMRFSKPGGVWEQLDYLPATPSEIRVEVEKAKKNKNRPAPAPTPAQVSLDLNAARAGDAAASRRHCILDGMCSYGLIGMHLNEIRKVKGAGRGPAVHQALQELEHAGSIERLPDNRWRVIGRTE
jgi:KaiC/GvpD/RAD55 family RecA-like ATPase